MAYTLYDLFTKIEWLRTRNVPLATNNVNTLMQIINSSPDYENYQIKLTGLTQDNSLFYYNVFTEIAGDKPLVDLLEETITPNNVRDAIQYVTSDDSLLLTQYCIDTTLNILSNYAQFIGYSERLEGITPETTQDYSRVLGEILYLNQFVFDASGFEIPNK